MSVHGQGQLCYELRLLETSPGVAHVERMAIRCNAQRTLATGVIMQANPPSAVETASLAAEVLSPPMLSHNHEQLADFSQVASSNASARCAVRVRASVLVEAGLVLQALMPQGIMILVTGSERILSGCVYKGLALCALAW